MGKGKIGVSIRAIQDRKQRNQARSRRLSAGELDRGGGISGTHSYSLAVGVCLVVGWCWFQSKFRPCRVSLSVTSIKFTSPLFVSDFSDRCFLPRPHPLSGATNSAKVRGLVPKWHTHLVHHHALSKKRALVLALIGLKPFVFAFSFRKDSLHPHGSPHSAPSTRSSAVPLTHTQTTHTSLFSQFERGRQNVSAPTSDQIRQMGLHHYSHVIKYSPPCRRWQQRPGVVL